MWLEWMGELGFDTDAFKAERVQPLVDGGWDEILARYYNKVWVRWHRRI